ncbi:MAG: hypothetical protein AAEJ47_10450 [Planctomycetota bacterium]
MIKPLPLLCLYLLILLMIPIGGSGVSSADGPSGQPIFPSVSTQDEPGNSNEHIEKAMEAVKSAGRKVRRALRKKDIDAALAAVNQVQSAVIEVKKLVPEAATKVEGDDASAIKRDFRQRLIAVLEQWLFVEKALLQGKTEEAAKFMKTISEMKKSAHEEYEVED